MDSVSTIPANDRPESGTACKWPTYHQQGGLSVETPDHFVRRGGFEFAGAHLIIDFWDASSLDNISLIETALRESVKAAGATLLHIHLHHFSKNGGISGVAVLAESHISVHTWPERNYAAFDVFMCGDAHPENVIPVLKRIFKPGRVSLNEYLRGLVSGND